MTSSIGAAMGLRPAYLDGSHREARTSQHLQGTVHSGFHLMVRGQARKWMFRIAAEQGAQLQLGDTGGSRLHPSPLGATGRTWMTPSSQVSLFTKAFPGYTWLTKEPQ